MNMTFREHGGRKFSQLFLRSVGNNLFRKVIMHGTGFIKNIREYKSE